SSGPPHLAHRNRRASPSSVSPNEIFGSLSIIGVKRVHRSSLEQKVRRPEADAPIFSSPANYMLLFEHFFALSSHAILAFSQAALVVGVLAAASAGDAKAAARPTATTTETSFFM